MPIKHNHMAPCYHCNFRKAPLHYQNHAPARSRPKQLTSVPRACVLPWQAPTAPRYPPARDCLAMQARAQSKGDRKAPTSKGSAARLPQTGMTSRNGHATPACKGPSGHKTRRLRSPRPELGCSNRRVKRPPGQLPERRKARWQQPGGRFRKGDPPLSPATRKPHTELSQIAHCEANNRRLAPRPTAARPQRRHLLSPKLARAAVARQDHTNALGELPKCARRFGRQQVCSWRDDRYNIEATKSPIQNKRHRHIRLRKPAPNLRRVTPRQRAAPRCFADRRNRRKP